MNRVGRYFLGLRRDTLPWLFVAFFLFVVAMTAIYILNPALSPSTTLRIGDGIFAAKVVAIDEAQRHDPVAPDVLTPGQAVLLAYDNEQAVLMSLQRSAVPVDLVWLNNDKKVVFIVKNVSKSTNNQFLPAKPARYILELAGGTVAQKTITIGSHAIFNEPRKGGF